jgi:hypothetical protein
MRRNLTISSINKHCETNHLIADRSHSSLHFEVVAIIMQVRKVANKESERASGREIYSANCFRILSDSDLAAGEG